jgi:hypothetical protein
MRLARLVLLDFAEAICLYVDVVDTVLELACHLVSVLVQRLLDQVLIACYDILSDGFGRLVAHHPGVVVYTGCKSMHLIDRSVEKLGAFVVEARIVVDGACAVSSILQPHPLAVEGFVEKPVANGDLPPLDEHHFMHLFVLVLNHLLVGLLVHPWLQAFDKVYEELFLLLLAEGECAWALG